MEGEGDDGRSCNESSSHSSSVLEERVQRLCDGVVAGGGIEGEGSIISRCGAMVPGVIVCSLFPSSF